MPTSSKLGDPDDVTGFRGIWSRTVANLQYQRWWSGWGIDNGDGATSDSPVQYDDIGTRYDVQFGWSAACHIRPDLQVSDTTVPFFKRGPQPYGATNAGWTFTGGAGNVYRVRISDGATQLVALGTTVQDPNATRLDMLTATYDRANLRLFVNGVLEATTAGTIAVGNPAGEDIKFNGFGPPPTESTFPSFIDMGCMWNRALTISEVRMLYSDPFIMWRLLDDDEGLADYQTFLLAF
jgi:hypothetical protein